MHIKNSSFAGGTRHVDNIRNRLSIQIWQNHVSTITDFCAKCNTNFDNFFISPDFFAFLTEQRKNAEKFRIVKLSKQLNLRSKTGQKKQTL